MNASIISLVAYEHTQRFWVLEIPNLLSDEVVLELQYMRECLLLLWLLISKIHLLGLSHCSDIALHAGLYAHCAMLIDL